MKLDLKSDWFHDLTFQITEFQLWNQNQMSRSPSIMFNYHFLQSFSIIHIIIRKKHDSTCKNKSRSVREVGDHGADRKGEYTAHEYTSVSRADLHCANLRKSRMADRLQSLSCGKTAFRLWPVPSQHRARLPDLIDESADPINPRRFLWSRRPDRASSIVPIILECLRGSVWHILCGISSSCTYKVPRLSFGIRHEKSRPWNNLDTYIFLCASHIYITEIQI